MPNNNASELVVPGDGQAYVAPVGTTLPADGSDPTADLDPAFAPLGYWTEDGATFNVGVTVAEFRAFQARQAVRREVTERAAGASFQMEQWNDDTVTAALGGSITESGGFFTYTPPAASDPLEEVALVIDLADGDRHSRFIYPRGNTGTEGVEVQFQRGQMALLPVQFKALEPLDGSPMYRILFDDDAAFSVS